MRECNALINWNAQSFWKFLYPKISIALRFWIIAIEHNDDSLSFFLDGWPNSFIFGAAWVRQQIPERSQNSIETNRLSTYVSCSTILTPVVGRYGLSRTFCFSARQLTRVVFPHASGPTTKILSLVRLYIFKFFRLIPKKLQVQFFLIGVSVLQFHKRKMMEEKNSQTPLKLQSITKIKFFININKLLLTMKNISCFNSPILYNAFSNKKQTKGIKNSSTLAKRDKKSQNPTSSLKKSRGKGTSAKVTPKTQKKAKSLNKSQRKEEYMKMKGYQMTTRKVPRREESFGITPVQYQTERERLQMLKGYLREDAEKMNKMKQISDHHVITQMKITQENLMRQINHSHEQSKIFLEAQQKQIQIMKKEKGQLIEKYQADKKETMNQLLLEKRKNQQLESKLKEYETIIANLKKKVSMVQDQYRILVKQNEPLVKEHSHTVEKIQKLETEVTQLEEKVANFQTIKKQFQKEIEKHRREKKYIKEQSEAVMKFLKEQY